MASNLFSRARDCIGCADPGEKLRLTHELAAAFARGEVVIDEDAPAPEAIGVPGRPGRPVLVPPREVPQRGLGSVEGRAAFLHAIAHIEFNAINLAWDAVYRFRGMPAEFYADWIGVADDEARHFELLAARLTDLGFAYGDFAAHDGLWEMAAKTADSCRARMALVPRVLEARGLDVTPGMIARLRSVGDPASAEILDLILREEVAHVAAGSRWFHWCCEREGIVPGREFIRLVRESKSSIRPPFNRVARLAAGFEPGELEVLETLHAAEAADPAPPSAAGSRRRTKAPADAVRSERKAKLRTWRDGERAKARAGFPLADGQLATFFAALESLHAQNGCRHDVRSAAIAIDALGLSDEDANRLMAWCNDHGGYCDCEIAANTFSHWHENRRA